MRKNDPVLFTDALKKECSLDDYIDRTGRPAEEITFAQGMMPDFLADEEPENIYGIADYIRMREAQKSAADVASELFKLLYRDDSQAATLTLLFVNAVRKGLALAQWQIDCIVYAYRKLSKVFNGAKKYDMDVVDFIDMVLYELAQIAMRGAA